MQFFYKLIALFAFVYGVAMMQYIPLFAINAPQRRWFKHTVHGFLLPAMIFPGVDGKWGWLKIRSNTFLEPMIWNTFIFFLFSMVHSVMASPEFKRKIYPQYLSKRLERSVFIIVSSWALHVFYYLWKPLPYVVLIDFGKIFGRTIAAEMMYGGIVAGLALTVYCVRQMHWKEWFGITQASTGALSEEQEGQEGQERKKKPELITTGVYSVIRNPMVLALLLQVWSMDVVTVSHVFFAILVTFYALFGTFRHEEPMLRRELGEKYEDYCKKVPYRLIPHLI